MKRSERHERNLRIELYRLRNPELSLEEIGEVFGLSKAAISLILQKMKVLNRIK